MIQGSGQPERSEAASGGSLLEAKLVGRLPCVFCGYELQGLSIRGQCPECGAAVRATILHRVDPAADEFSPISSRRIVALGLVLWPAGALLAGAAAWAQRGLELLRVQFGVNVHLSVLGAVVVIGAVLSAVGAVGLIRPTRETALWSQRLAFFVVLE